MEGGDKEMEVDVIKQQDDDSIQRYRDQIMEEKVNMTVKSNKLSAFTYLGNFCY